MMESMKIKPAWIFALLLLVFIASRCVRLDSDIPLLGVTEYCMIDEMYYNHAAFNLYHYGEYAHRVISYINDTAVHNNVLENVLTFFTLKIWGNNYYGLRMASVLASALVLLGLFLIFKQAPFYRIRKNKSLVQEDNNSLPPVNTNLIHAEENINQGTYDQRAPGISNMVVVLLALVYCLVDFPFMLSGRVAEPTIFRILAMIIIICFAGELVRRDKLSSTFWSFWLGFIAFCAVFFVYLYNAFIFAAAGISLAAWNWSWGWKKVLKILLWYLIGAAFGLLAYMGFVHFFLNSNLSGLVDILAPYAYRVGGRGDSLLADPRHYFMNFLAIFTTNFFRLNIAVLFVFVVSLPVVVYRAIKEKEPLVILFCNLLIWLVLQCIVINDFNFRKLIIIEPLVIALAILAIAYTREFRAWLIKKAFRRRVFKLYWIITGCLFVMIIHLGSIKPASLNSEIIINPQVVLPSDINRINLIVFLAVFLIVTMYYLGDRHLKKYWLLAAFILMLLPGIYLNARYLYMHPEYTMRDTMIELKDRVDGKVIAGGVGYGFRLYNNSIPVLDFYRFAESKYKDPLGEYIDTLKRIFRENRADYSLQLHLPTEKEERDYAQYRGLKIVKHYDYYVTLYGPED